MGARAACAFERAVQHLWRGRADACGATRTLKTIEQLWDDAIVPAITEYIRIPAKSPHFDRDWQKHGYIEAALQLAVKWGGANPLKGMKLEVVRLEGRTPVLFVEVAGEGSETVLIYGHLDKQPEMVGWHEGF